MKKTLIALMLCFVSIMGFCQVTIQKTQKTDEIVLSSGNGYIYHDKITDEYYLGIASDNHFEDKLVIVKLGTGKEETIKSIQAIESTWESSKDGDTFEVNGINCTVNKSMVYYLRFESPKYSAGTYYIACEFSSKLGLFDRALKKYKKGKF